MLKYSLLFILGLMTTTLVAQQHKHGQEAIFHEVSNQSVVQRVYPEAATVKKVNDFWYEIVDKKGNALGYAMNSTDYCKDVKGYRNTTPVMIITDKAFVIKQVSLLSNYEDLNYINRLNAVGFFDKWVGKKVKEASSIQIDGRTGATYSANAISKNVNFLLENGSKKLP
jgi:Na+-translocating ferredoxin:NAD+ oxidoreductase subunit G